MITSRYRGILVILSFWVHREINKLRCGILGHGHESRPAHDYSREVPVTESTLQFQIPRRCLSRCREGYSDAPGPYRAFAGSVTAGMFSSRTSLLKAAKSVESSAVSVFSSPFTALARPSYTW